MYNTHMILVASIFAALLTNLCDIASTVEANPSDCRAPFRVTATVSYVVCIGNEFTHILTENDGTGIVFPGVSKKFLPTPGDILHIEGRFKSYGANSVKPHFSSLRKVGRGRVPVPFEGSTEEIMSGRHDFQRCHLVGEVRDVVPSGTDPCWNYLSIIADDQQYYAPIPTRGAALKQLEALVGSTVQLDGFPDSRNGSLRFLDERRFIIADLDHIKILSPPGNDLFSNSPSVDELHRLHPDQISRLGRHRATGRILTLWQGCHALLELKDSRKALVSFSDRGSCSRGDNVEVVGYPSTDGFTLRLSRALARPLPGPAFSEPATTVFSSTNISERLSEAFLDRRSLQGRRIQIGGVLTEFNASPRARGVFSLAVAEHLLDVDFSSQPHIVEKLITGCRVRVTGTCVLDTENWTTLSEGTQLNGIKLVIDRGDDLEVLQWPPWWTPSRLSAIVALLLVLVVGCMVWNRSLHRLSEKRGRELFQERTASALAELKMDERTRLAVELHDSISQTLTGAALQLDAGEISAAKRILASCRRELRACLWDLRSHAIDAEHFADAVRETLAPHIGDRQVSIDLDFPSSSISEALRHAALRIIREASVNAVRHGHATTIAISGELSGRKLMFSVVDDGRGFAPANVPGSSSGHFGILGMRERAKAFNGHVNISSSPGNGTEVSVILAELCDYDLGDNDVSEKAI